jgi:3-hydroxyisobutyrate dehydrogenase-like beta-hydroxyacid dehydrogenase
VLVKWLYSLEGIRTAQTSLDIFVKDMGRVDDEAQQHGYPAPLAGAAEQFYLAGRRAGLGRQDDSSVIEILRGGASVSAASPPTVGETASVDPR